MKKRLLLYLFVLIGILSLNSPCYAIKIGLQVNADWVGIGSSGNTSIIDANTNKTVVKIDGMKGYEIVPYKNTMAIKLDGKFYQIYSDYVVIKPPEGGFISAKNQAGNRKP